MPRARRQMALTTDLVARAYRVVEDTGLPPAHGPQYRGRVGRRCSGDARVSLRRTGHVDLRLRVAALEAGGGARRGAVGSRPGWHRSFCMRMKTWRGTEDQPGLMMALDRGGQCKGVAYRLPERHGRGPAWKTRAARDSQRPSGKPPTHVPHWIGGRDGPRTHSCHRIRDRPERTQLCGRAHARRDGRHLG